MNFYLFSYALAGGAVDCEDEVRFVGGDDIVDVADDEASVTGKNDLSAQRDQIDVGALVGQIGEREVRLAGAPCHRQCEDGWFIGGAATAGC